MVFKHLSYAGGWEETSLCILVLAITIPFPNFNGYSIYFWEWMLNFSPCNFLSISGLKLIHVSEKGPWSIPWSGKTDVKCNKNNMRVPVTLAMAAHGGSLIFTI